MVLFCSTPWITTYAVSLVEYWLVVVPRLESVYAVAFATSNFRLPVPATPDVHDELVY